MILGDFFFLRKKWLFWDFWPSGTLLICCKNRLIQMIFNWKCHLRPFVATCRVCQRGHFFFFLPKLVENQKKHIFLVGFDHPHRIWGPTEKNVLDHFRPHKQKNHKIWCFVFCKNHFRPQKQNIKSVPGCQKSEKSHFFLRKKKSCKIVRFKS